MINLLTILLGVIILDFTLFGFFAYIFGIWPGFRHLLSEGILINDNTENLYRRWERNRFKSLILTKKHLILRNSMLTSVKNIDINLIDRCLIKKKGKNRSKVQIMFKDNDKESKIVFISDKAKKWDSAFRKIGVKVQM